MIQLSSRLYLVRLNFLDLLHYPKLLTIEINCSFHSIRHLHVSSIAERLPWHWLPLSHLRPHKADEPILRQSISPRDSKERVPWVLDRALSD